MGSAQHSGGCRVGAATINNSYRVNLEFEI